MASSRPFRFGVHTSDAQTGDDWASAARRYESLGFSTLMLRDHFDQQLAPIVAMTAAACATETLRVGCLVFANDYRHPLVLAKELLTLDRLSGGRVEVGLGAGWMGSDYEQAGLAFDAPRDRVSRLEEAVRVIKALFVGGSVDFSGDHYTVASHEMYPPSVQKPGPPMLLVAGGPRMTRFAAAEADIVAINPATKSNEAWAEQNLADASADAVDRKITVIRGAAGSRYDDIELQIVVPFVVPTDDREGTARAIADSLPSDDPTVDLSAETVLASPYVLIGTEDQICDTLVERRERWDLSYYVFNDDSIDAVAPIVARLNGRVLAAAPTRPQPGSVGDMPSDLTLKAMNGLHRALVKATFGRVGWTAGPMPVLELTTTGRKSGQPRSVMLTSPVQEGDTWVVVASRGGDDQHPAWFLNLRDHPEVQVSLQGKPKQSMRARIATPDERARLWPQVTTVHKGYAGYQEKTDREIPLVLLEPSS